MPRQKSGGAREARTASSQSSAFSAGDPDHPRLDPHPIGAIKKHLDKPLPVTDFIPPTAISLPLHTLEPRSPSCTEDPEKLVATRLFARPRLSRPSGYSKRASSGWPSARPREGLCCTGWLAHLASAGRESRLKNAVGEGSRALITHNGVAAETVGGARRVDI